MSKLQETIAKRLAEAKISKEERENVLAENEEYVNLMVDTQLELAEIKKLDKILDNLNGIKAITANDGSVYKVHAYPVATSIFDMVSSRVLAIVRASGAMFTEERQAEYTALTGIPYLIASKASKEIGSPKYFSKGKVSDEILPGSFVTLLIAVYAALNVPEEMNTITVSTLNRWFEVEARKAKTKDTEFKKNQKIDLSSEFTLED